jgi:hypothetical protein
MFGRFVSAAFATAATAAIGAAQVPGAPVLQNAFANPGIAIAANFAGGSGQSFYGAAAAWGLWNGRFQVSGAAGVSRSNGSTRGAYGGRAAMSLWSTSGGALGLGAFAGIGGSPSTKAEGVVNNPAVTNIPAGVTIGYRHTLGSRGFSAYASPLYRWTHADFGPTTESTGALRVAAGIDFGLSTSLGVTVGGEFGGNTADGKSSGLFGAAISFVPGRR